MELKTMLCWKLYLKSRNKEDISSMGIILLEVFLVIFKMSSIFLLIYWISNKDNTYLHGWIVCLLPCIVLFLWIFAKGYFYGTAVVHKFSFGDFMVYSMFPLYLSIGDYLANVIIRKKQFKIISKSQRFDVIRTYFVWILLYSVLWSIVHSIFFKNHSLHQPECGIIVLFLLVAWNVAKYTTLKCIFYRHNHNKEGEQNVEQKTNIE